LGSAKLFEVILGSATSKRLKNTGLTQNDFTKCSLLIDAPFVPPQKNSKKLDHKNAIKYKNRGPLPRFSYNPKYQPQKYLKMIGIYAG
jgi:hypothetical protein